eukprot:TRINITY_DN11295_c0_g1_i1.p1 TRINITY_DN11295_c0_g1~~TRINITY_DN11295_c0_g1_i1.p1  ORF type:complete len:469 (+),score=170.92 TRINITY_DN11295_c0_g1_i1:147-1553(+)
MALVNDDDQISDHEGEDEDRDEIARSLQNQRPETPDWMDQAQRIITDAQQSKAIAIALRNESNQIRAAVEKQVNEQTRNVNEQLKKKIADTASQKAKIEKRIQLLQAEIEGLQRLRNVAAKQLAAREGPLQVAERRVRIRSQRPQREQIYDSVERALQTEYRDLRNAVDQLTAAVETADAHLQKMEFMEKQLQLDLDDKETALQLDQDCLDLLVNPDAPLRVAGGVPKLETTEPPRKSAGLPELWKRETDQLLDDSVKLEQQAVRLKKNLKTLLGQIRDANVQSNSLSNAALKKKLGQSTKVHSQLAQHLNEINEEMEQLEAAKQQLQVALQAEEKPLAVVQRRLAIRQQRPQREAVRDAVEEALENELTVINQTLSTLKQKIASIDAEQQRLLSAKNLLLDDLQDKSHALKLDKSCLELAASEADGQAPTDGTLPKMTPASAFGYSPRIATRIPKGLSSSPRSARKH